MSSYPESVEDKGDKESIGEPNDSPPRPYGLQRRNSLASLNMASMGRKYPGEPTWPREPAAYMTLFAGFLLMFNSWGLVNAYGTYSSIYNDRLLPDSSISLLNLVGATQSFVVLLFSFIVGRFLDAGYYRQLILAGTFLITAGSFSLGFVNGDAGYGSGNYIAIWATQGLLMGLGMACFFVTSSYLAATWFRPRKGLAIGIVASGASIAGVVYPSMLRFLNEAIGFRYAQCCVAGVTTATSLLAFALAKSNPDHTYRKILNRKDYREFIDIGAFRNRQFNWMVAAIAWLFLGFYAIFFNLEEWAASAGIAYRMGTPPLENGIQTWVLLAIMNGTSTVGRWSSAWMCDKWGALKVHAAVTAFASFLVLAIWSWAYSLPHTIVFVVVFGMFSGAVIGLPPASMAYILGKKPEGQAKLGQWTGMMYTVASIPAIVGPTVAGLIATAAGENFLVIQLWAGFSLFFSSSCMFMAFLCHRRAQKEKESLEKSTSSSTTETSGETGETNIV